MNGIRKIYNVLNKISDFIERKLKAVIGVLIFTCAFTLLLQVVYRFILVRFVTLPLTFTEEYARYALIWSTYFSLGICFKEGSMASVNFIYDRLKPRPKLVLYYVTRIIVLMFLVIGLVYGAKATQNNLIYNSPSMRIPGVFLYSAPFVGCALMIYEVIIEIIGVICGEIEPFAARKIAEEYTEAM